MNLIRPLISFIIQCCYHLDGDWGLSYSVYIHLECALLHVCLHFVRQISTLTFALKSNLVPEFVYKFLSCNEASDSMNFSSIKERFT